MNIIILLFICIIKLHVIPLKVESIMSFSSNNFSSEVNKSFYKFIIIFLLYYIFPRLLFKFVNSRYDLLYIYFNKRNFFIICIYEIKLLIIYFLLYLKFNILFFKLFSFYCIMILGIFKFIIFSFLRIYSKYLLKF